MKLLPGRTLVLLAWNRIFAARSFLKSASVPMDFALDQYRGLFPGSFGVLCVVENLAAAIQQGYISL